MKSCTDLEQSKKLIELGIDANSADLLYSGVHLGSDGKYYKSDDNWVMTPEYFIQLLHNCESDIKNQLPAWSLDALSKFILPYIADDDGNNYKFYLSKDGLNRWIAYYKSGNVSIHICEESDNMIDVIFEMVCWLKSEKYI